MEKWCLTLVGPDHPLPDDFCIETTDVHGKPFDIRAAKALHRLFDDAQSADFLLEMVSGYRSVEYQKELVERSLSRRIKSGMTRAEAEAETALYVAQPGCSEHNLGLAADIVSCGWFDENDDLEDWFDRTPHFAWLKENAWKYGFILRYPKDKTHITGIGYEPWHYRYVGAEAAKLITKTDITLEEFHEKYLRK